MPQDSALTYSWFTLMADHENGAIRNTARSGRDLVAQKLDPNQIADAEPRARTWTPLSETQ